MSARAPETGICFNPDESDPEAIMDQFHAHLKQVVALHAAMFEKLLFQSDDLPLELAELFEDVANTYLDFSEHISRRALERRARD